MEGNSFEMYASERLAARDQEAAAFAAQRAMVRAAGGGFWTHLFGVMPIPRRSQRRQTGTPVTTRPVGEGR